MTYTNPMYADYAKALEDWGREIDGWENTELALGSSDITGSLSALRAKMTDQAAQFRLADPQRYGGGFLSNWAQDGRLSEETREMLAALFPGDSADYYDRERAENALSHLRAPFTFAAFTDAVRKATASGDSRCPPAYCWRLLRDLLDNRLVRNLGTR